MSDSNLVSSTHLSPHNSGDRIHPISRITPHCYVGQATIGEMESYFSYDDTMASCNYAIGKDGKISLIVPENFRSWCSSSRDNDNKAITIECACDSKPPYKFNQVVFESLIKLSADICTRNGKTQLLWMKDRELSLHYTPCKGEMVVTVHRWFANKECPGEWMMKHMDEYCAEVNKILKYPQSNAKKGEFLVKVHIDCLNIRTGPSWKCESLGFILPGVYTITETVKEGWFVWGKLKSGVGWIALNYVTRVKL